MSRRRDKMPPLYVRWDNGNPSVALEPADGLAKYVQQTGAMLDNAGSDPDIRTPAEFVSAVKRYHGPIAVDLAAKDAGNAVDGCQFFITPEVDSLKQDWGDIAAIVTGHLWLNPPYNAIGPWVKRAALYAPCLRAGQKLLVLVPASVGARYWQDHVDGRAFEQQVGRIAFDGYKSASMKDHCLLVYTCDRPHNLHLARYWEWKKLLTAGELATYQARTKGVK